MLVYYVCCFYENSQNVRYVINQHKGLCCRANFVKIFRRKVRTILPLNGVEFYREPFEVL